MRTSVIFFPGGICYFLPPPRCHIVVVIIYHWAGLVCFTALYSEAHIHGAPGSNFFSSLFVINLIHPWVNTSLNSLRMYREYRS